MSKAKIPDALIYGFFSSVKGIKGEVSEVVIDTRLNASTIKKIIKTFPPVWNFELTGFMVYDYKTVAGQTSTGFFILGKYDFGTLSYIVSDVVLETIDNKTFIRQLSTLTQQLS